MSQKRCRSLHLIPQRKYCDLCPTTSLRKTTIKAHIKMVHLKKKRFGCNICDFQAYSRTSLRIHSYIHQDLTECNICYKRVANIKGHVRQHSLEHVPCKICGKMIKKSCIPMHVRTVHLKVPRNRRRKTVKTWFCDLCPITCKEKNRLITHMESKHLMKRPFKCNVCGHLCSNVWNLRIHAVIHQDVTECKICNKKVTHIVRHMKGVHLSEKVLCKICGKAMNKNGLSKHIKSIHNKISKKILCDQCNEFFPSQNELKW